MVTGAYPPDVCGVGDYTGKLVAAAPSLWRPFVERNWSLRAAIGIFRRLLRLHPSHLVIQYPTQGYGWSLVPHFIILFGWMTRRYRSALSLHEFSSLSRKARLSLALISRFVSHIIFTTEVERDRARAHWLFSPAVPTSVIGILSNIPCTMRPPAFTDRKTDIAYFGHIRPNKGLETYLDAVAAVRQADAATRTVIIGEIPKGYEAFADMVKTRCRTIGCELIIGLDDHEVGRRLADVRILYLPFPDGASARRGSLLAGLGNGAVIATTIGNATPDSLLPAVIPCSGSRDDSTILLQTLQLSNTEAEAKQQAGRNYIETMLPRDWSHVAELYEIAVIGGHPRSRMAPC